VLVHSVRGQSRCVVVVASYLMKKYKWSLYKTLEFLSSRRPDIELRPSYVNQLADYEKRLDKTNRVKTTKWNEL
jgi:protein-tyrosine phosphatase